MSEIKPKSLDALIYDSMALDLLDAMDSNDDKKLDAILNATNVVKTDFGENTHRNIFKMLVVCARKSSKELALYRKQYDDYKAKQREKGAQGGEQTALNNPKSQAVKDVYKMWCDWNKGNKEPYKHRGKTGKTAFVRHVLDVSHKGILESESYLMTLTRDWSKGKNLPKG